MLITSSTSSSAMLAAANELHKADLWFDLISLPELRAPSSVQTKHWKRWESADYCLYEFCPDITRQLFTLRRNIVMFNIVRSHVIIFRHTPRKRYYLYYLHYLTTWYLICCKDSSIRDGHLKKLPRSILKEINDWLLINCYFLIFKMPMAENTKYSMFFPQLNLYSKKNFKSNNNPPGQSS